MNDYLVKLTDVSLSYDDTLILDKINLEIFKGQIYILKGSSGIGKSSLLNIISGLTLPTAGKVEYSDSFSISYDFQDNRLIDHLDPIMNIKLTSPKTSEKDIVRNLLKLLPSRVLLTPTGDLSGGERRRVSLIRAMLYDSSLVLLDEPFSGLDKSTISKCYEYIDEMLSGRALIITSHEGLPEMSKSWDSVTREINLS